MVNRILKNQILNQWDDDKVIVLIGARQVGKSTLVKEICNEKGQYLFLNGDDIDTLTLLNGAGEKKLRQIIGLHKIVFIDEVQRIENIGLISKIIHDQIKDVKLIISGSSALEINNQINEPLTGRKWEYHLYPISWNEYQNTFGFMESKLNLEKRLIFGMYPEVLNNTTNEINVLKQLTSSYLYKDILSLHNIRKPDVLDKLLVALALQVGSEVNYNELSNLLKINRNTVEDYITLLEKLFIVFRLPALSRNERKEIANSRKIYFYDNGIRNTILGDFKPLSLRQDIGKLWENFMVSELIKKTSYDEGMFRKYFWRTYQQQEVDFVLEYRTQMKAFEIKWNPRKNPRLSKTFLNLYPDTEFTVITNENFYEYL